MNKIKQILKKQAFTLVELIIVIAIIAVLAVAAFMMLTKWLGKSRDSRRISDLGTIKKALEVTYSDTDNGLNIYPDPTSSVDVLDMSGVVMWNQGVFGLDTIEKMDNMQRAPQDPSDGGYYKYAVTLDKKEFQLGTVLEDGTDVSIAGSVLAANGEARIDGNYDGYVSYPTTGGTMILKTPSLLVNGTPEITNINGTSDKFMVNGKNEGDEIILKSIKTDGNTTAEQVAVALGIDTKEAAIVIKKETGAVVETGETNTGDNNEIVETIDNTSCNTLYESGKRGSGTYTIDPDGDGGKDPFEVYCDMETDGGGWTRIFYQNYENSIDTTSINLLDSSTRNYSFTEGVYEEIPAIGIDPSEIMIQAKTTNEVKFKFENNNVALSKLIEKGIKPNELPACDYRNDIVNTNGYNFTTNTAITNATIHFYSCGAILGERGEVFDMTSEWRVTNDSSSVDVRFSVNGVMGNHSSHYTAIYIKGMKAPPTYCEQSDASCSATDATSCKWIKTEFDTNQDGVYWIDPDGENGSNPFKVYCDMNTDGGGWTLVTFSKGNASTTFDKNFMVTKVNDSNIANKDSSNIMSSLDPEAFSTTVTTDDAMLISSTYSTTPIIENNRGTWNYDETDCTGTLFHTSRTAGCAGQIANDNYNANDQYNLVTSSGNYGIVPYHLSLGNELCYSGHGRCDFEFYLR